MPGVASEYLRMRCPVFVDLRRKFDKITRRVGAGKRGITLAGKKICGLPMERYFNPEVMREESELRQRVGQKLKLCPEQYLPIVEGAIDGALKIEKPNEETEGV